MGSDKLAKRSAECKRDIAIYSKRYFHERIWHFFFTSVMWGALRVIVIFAALFMAVCALETARSGQSGFDNVTIGDGEVVSHVTESIYYSVTTFVTEGGGKICPVSRSARALSVVECLTALLLFGFTLTYAASTIHSRLLFSKEDLNEALDAYLRSAAMDNPS